MKGSHIHIYNKVPRIFRRKFQVFLAIGLCIIISYLIIACSSFLITSSRTENILSSSLKSSLYFKSLLSHDNSTESSSSEGKSRFSDDTNDNLNSFAVQDPDNYFNKKVEDLYNLKLSTDLERKYWVLDVDITKDSRVEIPSYFYRVDSNLPVQKSSDAAIGQQIGDSVNYISQKPIIQPFDPRFTLGIYYHYLKQNLPTAEHGLKVPFNWYDWVDLSALNPYLLASSADLNRPSCDLLDARQDELRLQAAMEAEEKEKERKIKILKGEDPDAPEPKKEDEESKEESKDKPKEESKEESKDKPKEESKDESKKEPKGESKEEPKEQPKEEKSEEAPKKDQPKEEVPKQNAKRDIVKRGNAEDAKKFCLNDDKLPHDHNDGHSIHPGFNAFGREGKVTEQKSILIGQSYLYSYAPPPSMIIFLTSDGSYNVTIDSEKNSPLVDNGLVEDYIAATKNEHIDVISEFKSLRSTVEANKNQVLTSYEVELDAESFHLDFDALTKQYQDNLLSLKPHEASYLEALKYSKYKLENGGPPKYFEEARLIETRNGDHYDWRFFHGLMYGTYDQTLVLHRLVRTWLSFTRKTGIRTWVAHGSLLSWYWDGIAFPWDNDIDVQVPLVDLHKLSLEFNQTIIVEDVEDGLGRYFLDCGTFITQRNKGNGNNNIDARFIDIDSGLYIDITGLSISDNQPPERYRKKLPEGWKTPLDENSDVKSWVETNLKLQVYNCRDNHFTHLNELSPLIKTSIEGEIGYIPNQYPAILKEEYRHGLSNKKFKQYVFLPQLRIWLHEMDLYYFMKDKSIWNKYHNYNLNYIESLEDSEFDAYSDIVFKDFQYELTEEELQKIHLDNELNEKAGVEGFKPHKIELSDNDLDNVYKLNYDEILDLLNKDDIFMNYYQSRQFTAFHEEEIMRLLFGKSTASLINGAPDFRPIRYDPFLYKLKNEYTTYEDQVARYMQLSQSYTDSENEIKNSDRGS